MVNSSPPHPIRSPASRWICGVFSLATPRWVPYTLRRVNSLLLLQFWSTGAPSGPFGLLFLDCSFRTRRMWWRRCSNQHGLDLDFATMGQAQAIIALQLMIDSQLWPGTCAAIPR
jgi:hypothetical protein